MDGKRIARFLAVNRIAIGAALTAVPALATRGWIGPHAGNEGAQLMARAIGGRDVGLGAGLLATLENRRQRVRWLEAAALADAVDFVATVAARRSLPPVPLAIGTSMAGASALAHLWLSRELG